MTIRRYDDTTIRRYDDTTIQPFNGKTLARYDITTIRHYDDTTIRRYDNTTIRHYDDTTIRRYNDTTIQRYDISTVWHDYNGKVYKRYGMTTVPTPHGQDITFVWHQTCTMTTCRHNIVNGTTTSSSNRRNWRRCNRRSLWSVHPTFACSVLLSFWKSVHSSVLPHVQSTCGHLSFEEVFMLWYFLMYMLHVATFWKKCSYFGIASRTCYMSWLYFWKKCSYFGIALRTCYMYVRRKKCSYFGTASSTSNVSPLEFQKNVHTLVLIYVHAT
jgi:hypothetical protein